MGDVLDLRQWLADWPYDPEKDARLTHGADGREILLVRTPLGLEQYELEGRPDSLRPYGMESALAYFLHRFAKAKAAGRADDFELSEEECAELFAEGTLYYYRYVHLFQLQDWKRTVRDTARNIRLFDHVRQHARRTEDQQHLEKWRPYLLRMNAVAAAMLELSEGHHPQAARLIHDAIHKLETLDELDDDTFRFERDRSLVALREMAEQLDQIRPLPEIERLERELRLAVETQAFERAARLRDRLRALRQSE